MNMKRYRITIRRTDQHKREAVDRIVLWNEAQLENYSQRLFKPIGDIIILNIEPLDNE